MDETRSRAGRRLPGRAPSILIFLNFLNFLEYFHVFLMVCLNSGRQSTNVLIKNKESNKKSDLPPSALEASRLRAGGKDVSGFLLEFLLSIRNFHTLLA